MPEQNEPPYEDNVSDKFKDAWGDYEAMIKSGYRDSKYMTLLKNHVKILEVEEFLRFKKLVESDLEKRTITSEIF